MADLAPAPPFEDQVDVEAKAPVIDPAAWAQLYKDRVKVDRYTIEPKHPASQP